MRLTGWAALGVAATISGGLRAQPFVGPETATDPPVVMGQLQATAGKPIPVSLGSNYLLVYTETIDGQLTVRGAHVDAQGTQTNPEGFHIANGGLSAAAFNGMHVLVLTRNDSGVFGVRVEPDGSIADPAPVFYGDPGENSMHSLAASGSTYLWTYTASGIVNAVRIGPDAAIVDTIPLAIGSGARPIAKWGGSSFHVIWQDNDSGLLIRGVSLNGSVSPTVQLTDDLYHPCSFDMACLSGACLVAYVRTFDCTPAAPDGNKVFGRRVAADGSLLDTVPKMLYEHPAAVSLGPTLASNQAKYLLSTGYEALDISAAGDPLGANLSFGYTAMWAPLASNGDDFMMTMDGPSYRRISGDAAISFLDPSAIDVDLREVDYANRQGLPDAAFNGAHYLAVWNDARFAKPTVLGTRVTPTGAIVDQPFAVAQEMVSPVVSSDTDMFQVFGGHGSHVVGAQISADATVLTPATGVSVPAFADYASPQTVAFDGTNYALVVAENEFVANNDKKGYIISQQHENLAYFPLGSDAFGTSPRDSDIAAGAGRYVIAHEYFSGKLYVQAVVLEADGTASVVFTHEVEQVYEVNGFGARHPTVDFDGSQFVVVFDTGGSLYAQRIASDGSLIDPAPILLGQGSNPRLRFGGNEHLLLWTSGGDVFAAFLSMDLQLGPSSLVPSVGPVPLVPENMEPSDPIYRLVADGAGQFLVTYRRHPYEAGYYADRAYFRRLGGDPLDVGAVCEQESQCSSTFCVDGFCCEMPCAGECVTCASSPGTCTQEPEGTPCSRGACYAGVCSAIQGTGGSGGDTAGSSSAGANSSAGSSHGAADDTDEGGGCECGYASGTVSYQWLCVIAVFAARRRRRRVTVRESAAWAC